MNLIRREGLIHLRGLTWPCADSFDAFPGEHLVTGSYSVTVQRCVLARVAGALAMMAGRGQLLSVRLAAPTVQVLDAAELLLREAVPAADRPAEVQKVPIAFLRHDGEVTYWSMRVPSWPEIADNCPDSSGRRNSV